MLKTLSLKLHSYHLTILIKPDLLLLSLLAVTFDIEASHLLMQERHSNSTARIKDEANTLKTREELGQTGKRSGAFI